MTHFIKIIIDFSNVEDLINIIHKSSTKCIKNTSISEVVNTSTLFN